MSETIRQFTQNEISNLTCGRKRYDILITIPRGSILSYAMLLNINGMSFTIPSRFIQY